MNNEWSEANKTMQALLKKETTFSEGLKSLFDLREKLFAEMFRFKKDLSREDFNAMPFINAKGYHSKTVAYSIWHIFRIEDIVAHTLIANDEQILFSGKYRESIGTPIITTGNELVKQQIAEFSRALDIEELYRYITDVKRSTEDILKGLPFAEHKRKVSEEAKERLRSLKVVSTDENAVWLIEYWCGKDIRGLIQMPFSRHWIMHVEASIRIKNKLQTK